MIFHAHFVDFGVEHSKKLVKDNCVLSISLEITDELASLYGLKPFNKSCLLCYSFRKKPIFVFS